MTHIRGPVDWWDAIFDSYAFMNDELVLYLGDGTKRKMEDWGEDTVTTLRHLVELDLSAGDAIRVATWGNRKKTEWFCDVVKI